LSTQIEIFWIETPCGLTNIPEEHLQGQGYSPARLHGVTDQSNVNLDKIIKSRLTLFLSSRHEDKVNVEVIRVKLPLCLTN
jgi:hypothetical protein